MKSEILTSGTRELYRLFGLPAPIVNMDINKVRVDVKPEMTDRQLMKFLKDGDEIICHSKKNQIPVPLK